MTIADLRQRTTLSVAEYAEVTGGGLTRAYEAIQRGEVPVVRHGRKVRVPVPFVLRLLGADKD